MSVLTQFKVHIMVEATYLSTTIQLIHSLIFVGDLVFVFTVIGSVHFSLCALIGSLSVINKYVVCEAKWTTSL